jgi:SAM-dependent methyltransferase
VSAAAWQISPDVTFGLADGGAVASNHRARRHVFVDAALMALLMGEKRPGPFSAADMTRFGNVDGLLADPTGIDRTGAGARVDLADANAAVDYLVQRLILVRDYAAYNEYFRERTSLLDRDHLGTFHQQLGAELRVKHRVDPDTWWYGQKFDPATGKVRDNLYKWVQEEFLDAFFAELDVHGQTVLDFGCGSGMASRRFTALGAKVIGVDPDPRQLERAAAQAGAKFTPLHFDLKADDPLALLPESGIDMLWMADVFLFYFHPMAGGAPAIPAEKLLSRLSRALKPRGRAVIMQPHGVFWLAPWLGTAERPYTLLTEYAHRLYSVTPSLERVSAAIAEAGLAITRIHEPTARGGEAVDGKATGFAREFPLWWVFECRNDA